MPEFLYKARSTEGKLVQDVMTSVSELTVADALFKSGLTPVEIIPKKNARLAHRFTTLSLFTRKIPSIELIMFCRQFSSLLGAGLPVATSLDRLAETARSKKFKATLMGVSSDVTGGKSLTVSLAQYPNIFPPIFISLVETGENTGNLDDAFKRLVSYLELELSIKRRIKTVLRYPITVAIAIAIAMTIINIVVIPSFSSMFSHFHAELPLPTRILMITSKIFVHDWEYLLAIFFALFAVCKLFLKTKIGRLKFDKTKLKLPLFGKIIKEILLMRFASLFAMIFRSGIPIVKGMSLMANSAGNIYIKNEILKMRDSIESGATILNATKISGLFPPLIIQMIAVGEESGTIDAMLEQVATYYEGEVDYNIKHLSEAMEPIFLVMIAGLVLMVALGVFLPMWNIASFAH
jgi:MSHA biogenesis protein MshG